MLETLEAKPTATQEPTPSLLWLVALCGALCTLAIFFPGFLSYDSIVQYTQVRGLIPFSNAHPPLMTFLWRLLDTVIVGPSGMLFLQALAWWLGLALIARNLTHRRFAPLLLLLLGFWPPLFASIGVIWKDCQMIAALTLAVGMLFEAQRTKHRGLVYGSLILIAYGTGVRINGMPAAIPLAFWAWSLLLKLSNVPKQTMRLLILSALLVMTLLLPAVINKRLSVVQTSPIQVLLVHDLLGISVEAGQNVLPSFAQPRPLKMEELQAMYSPFNNTLMYSANPRLLTIAPENIASLKRVWLQAVSKYPAAYLKHRATMFSKQLGLSPHVYYPYHLGIEKNDFGIMWSPSSFSRLAFSLLDRLTDSWLFRAWLYLLLAVLALLDLLQRLCQRLPASGAPLAILLSGLFYTAPYFLITGAADFRYNLWTIECTLLALLCLRKTDV